MTVAESEHDQVITREQFNYLRGVSITISETEKYSTGKIPSDKSRNVNIIHVLKEGYGGSWMRLK